MDDRTAYDILGLKPWTRLEDISKKHKHFVILYKQYLMGYKLNICPEEIEKMKEAYEHLLYRRINDNELASLYPIETPWGRVWENTLKPFMYRHKAKVIYTAVMSMLTVVIIYILNYKPVDLNVVVFTKHTQSVLEYEARIHILRAFEEGIPETVPQIGRTKMNYGFYSEGGDIAVEPLLQLWDDADVYIMEESLYNKFQQLGIVFTQIDKDHLSDYQQTSTVLGHSNYPVTEVYIDMESNIYKNICNWQNTNNDWIAVIAADAKNMEEALEFIGLLVNSRN